MNAVAKSKATKAKKAAEGAWSNPYVQRVVEDAELRDNVRAAYDSARSAYGRLANGKPAAKVVMDDKKFQKELKQAADALKEASTALRQGPKKQRKGGGLGKLLLVAIVGGALAIGLSEDLRSKVLDALFGKEEEFDYSSTTAPASAPPASVAAG
ncbi:MAG TPA: hypothetical protein VFT42_08545 [Solirubrobacteraceae bacterium]|nr:hypothetical protein [Solirubrobacteraceae bacterium]